MISRTRDRWAEILLASLVYNFISACDLGIFNIKVNWD